MELIVLITALFFFFFFSSIRFSDEFHVVIMMFLMKPVRIMKVETDESANKHSNL